MRSRFERKRRPATTSVVTCAVLIAGMILCGFAWAQGADEDEDFSWDWGSLGGFGYFNFRNSLFVDREPDSPGNLSEDWGEFFIKPWVSFEYAVGTGVFYGKASWVYSKTGENAAEISGGSASSSDLDDFWVAWTSGEVDGDGFGLGAGRYPYVIANQFLLSDGYADGGSRAGYWSNPRRAWKKAVAAFYEGHGHHVTAFYLRRDEQPESDSDTRISGINYEWTSGGDRWQLGASYLATEANEMAAQRDGADIINLRVYATPFDAPFTVEAEWVDEDNGLALQANAWYIQPYWTFENLSWKPVLYYRYAYFEGDNPDTLANENYDPLFPGFYDWGSWWQGEIAGEYFLSNSNLKTHMLRLHTTPTDKISTGLLFFDYTLDQTGSYQGGVISDEIGQEINWYMDWKFHKYFSVSFVLARTQPGKAVEEAHDRTKDFKYGMIYFGLNY